MTFAKRFLLGSAAAMTMVGAAQAADLPLAEPVEYVKVCNTYGEGFFYIPGSDTCLKVGGYVRAEYYAFDKKFIKGPNDTTSFLARGDVDFDARTETEYGTLRSFIRLEVTRTSGSGDLNSTGEAATSGNSRLAKFAFIQFAGLTAGRATSFFDFYANSNLFGTVAGSDLETQTLAYTASFGSGFSATIAIEDATERRVGSGNYGPQEWPDVVANIRVEQGWGAAQLSGALHNNNPPRGNGDGKELGWAIQPGIKFNLPFLAEGDTLFIQGSYSRGALGYTSSNFGFNGFIGTTADDFDTDLGNMNTNQTKAWAVSSELTHYWTPTVRSVFAGSYMNVNDARFGADYREIVGVGSVIWSPVKKLDIGVEVGYTNVEYKNDTNDRALGYDGFAGIMRVQRNF